MANNNEGNDDVGEIERRLSELRSTSAVQQRDIEERLAKLTDRDPSFYTSNEPPVKILSLAQQKSKKTDVEAADDLLAQYLEEAKLEEKEASHSRDVDRDIEKRLESLKEATAQLGLGPSTSAAATSSSSLLPSNAPTLPPIEQILKEAAEEPYKSKVDTLIDSILENPRRRNSVDDLDTDEEGFSPLGARMENDMTLDWCEICNEDAVIRCRDCRNEKYCRECFHDMHKDPDMKRHKPVKYKPRNPRYSF